LYEIDILALKSLFEIPPIASSTFAPIDVPDFNICLERTYSFFTIRALFKLIILMEN